MWFFTYLGFNDLWTLTPPVAGWTRLPCPRGTGGTSNKQHLCAGCRLGISLSKGTLICTFSFSGFPFRSGHRAVPCRTIYHPQCIRIGDPFRTRRRHQAGLSFPSIKIWPNFICEACTVRAVLDRELTGEHDKVLLCLERVRLLDLAHSWSPGTHRTYQHKLQLAARFDETFGTTILRPSPLPHPPRGPEIPAMWLQESQSLQPSSRRRDLDGTLYLSFSTIRHIRSAVSYFYTVDMMATTPQLIMDPSKHVLAQPCRPTDQLNFSLFTAGFKARIGDSSAPSVALLDRHVRFLDTDLERRYRQAASPRERHLIAMGGFTNVNLWLTWFRSSEHFSLTSRDVTIVHPSDGPTEDLPIGCGVIKYRLLPETKSTRSHRPDVVVCFTSLSGYRLGRWLLRVRNSFPSGHWGTSDLPLVHYHMHHP